MAGDSIPAAKHVLELAVAVVAGLIVAFVVYQLGWNAANDAPTSAATSTTQDTRPESAVAATTAPATTSPPPDPAPPTTTDTSPDPRTGRDSSGLVEVPDIVGVPDDEAWQLLTNLGLTPNSDRRDSPTVPVNHVISVDHLPGTMVSPRTVIFYLTSNGMPVEAPSVVGLSEDNARDQLAEFDVYVQYEATTDPSQDGTVTAQSPLAGEDTYVGTLFLVMVATYS